MPIDEVYDYVANGSIHDILKPEPLFALILFLGFLSTPYYFGFKEAGILLPAIFLIFLFYLFYKHRKIRNTIIKEHEVQPESMMVVTEESITISSIHHESVVRWSAYKSYKILDKVIIVFADDGTYLSISKSIAQANQQYDELIEVLREKVKSLHFHPPK
jgi:hypothetical protein